MVLKADASVVIPRVTEVAADHVRAVFGLSADTEAGISLEVVVVHHVLQVVDWPNLEDSLGSDPPNGDKLLQSLQQNLVGLVAILCEVAGVFEVLLKLLKAQFLSAKDLSDCILPV